MTRRQVRRMVRHESVITTLVGAAMGSALGLGLAGIVTWLLRDEGLAFSVPTGQLAVFAVIAVGAGAVAAIGPARRSARMDVLHALQYE
jgi:putative ABC transport system permease protein